MFPTTEKVWTTNVRLVFKADLAEATSKARQVVRMLETRASEMNRVDIGWEHVSELSEIKDLLDRILGE